MSTKRVKDKVPVIKSCEVRIEPEPALKMCLKNKNSILEENIAIRDSNNIVTIFSICYLPTIKFS